MRGQEKQWKRNFIPNGILRVWITLSDTEGSDISEGKLPDGWNGSLDGAAPECKTASEDKADSENGNENHPFRQFLKELGEIQEGKGTENYQDEWNLAEDTGTLSNDIARKKYHEEKEKQLAKDLKKDADKLPLGEIHNGCKFEIIRSAVISERLQKKYTDIEPEINKICRSL